MATTQYEAAIDALLKSLPVRTREVLERRYGLLGSQPETLEGIGEDFGVTRERVRQIEDSGFQQLRNQAREIAAPIFTQLYRHLEQHGGLRAEHHFFDDYEDQVPSHALQFLLDLGEPFTRHRETTHRHPVWSIDHGRIKEAESFVQDITAQLRKTKKDLVEAAFWEMVEAEARRHRLELNERAQKSWVGISRVIGQGPLKTWGLREWPEIAPHNVGDWAYIVLRASNEPLHFTDIVSRINKTRKDAKAHINESAHVQTVHNELIRDPRFVLVGRGLYALRDWGYEPGTVRDVITQVMKEAKKPLSREEVVAKVASVRRVQTNTIILNLQNRAVFSRTADGRYILR